MEDKDGGATEGASSDLSADLASNIVAAMAGLPPIPPEIKKSLWKAFAMLIHGAADVPTAWLQSKAEQIRSESAARGEFVKEIAKVAAGAAAADSDLVSRAALNFGARVFREQKNREGIMTVAFKAIAKSPSLPNATTQVDDDWLSLFARTAEQFSGEQAQMHFGRLLAGEIQRPGSFSPAAIHALATMSAADADLFRQFCDLTISFEGCKEYVRPHLFVEPFGRAPNNALKEFGLSYTQLLELQQAGLIATDFGTNATTESAQLPTSIGGERIEWAPDAGFDVDKATDGKSVILFTTIGLQLRQLVDLGSNPDFRNKVVKWYEATHSVKGRVVVS